MYTAQELTPAYTPSPGEILATELAERGWSQRKFAQILGKPPQAVNEILRSKKQITPETALRIAAALGTSAELWLNLQKLYELRKAEQEAGEEIKRTVHSVSAYEQAAMR